MYLVQEFQLYQGNKTKLNQYGFPLDVIDTIFKFYHDPQQYHNYEYHWFECDDLKMKYEMCNIGYVLCHHYIVTFGG